MQSEATSRVLAALGKYKRKSSGFVALCPAHDDSSPSLRVAQGDQGQVLLKCRAGCATEAVLQALQLHFRDLWPGGRDGKRPAPPARAGKRPAPPARAEPAAPPPPKWRDLARACCNALDWTILARLSSQLGVPADALVLLRTGWISGLQLKQLGNRRAEAAYTFPEVDGAGRVCGISLRWPDGAKGFVTGGNRGLTVPTSLADQPGTVYAVEGASDVAALTTMGLAAVGRPSCNGGVDHLARLLKRREVCVLGENDRKGDHWPGRDGARQVARKLAERLRRPVEWALPPAAVKDARGWLQRHPGARGPAFIETLGFRTEGARARQAEQAFNALRRDKGAL